MPRLGKVISREFTMAAPQHKSITMSFWLEFPLPPGESRTLGESDGGSTDILDLRWEILVEFVKKLDLE